MIFTTRNILTVLALLLVISSFGQPGGGGNPGGGPPVPITGVEVLIAAGGLLGWKFLTRKAKEK
jgi:hypothetical protein